MGDVTLRVKATGGQAAKGVLTGVRDEVSRLEARTQDLAASTRANAEAMKGVQGAAQQAGQSYRRVQTEAERAAEFIRLMPASLRKSSSEIAQAGQELAETYTRSLRRAYELAQADTKEALARGLITPQEAEQQGQEAGRAFNSGVLKVIEQRADAGDLRGRRGQDLFVGLTNQLKDLDQAASRVSTRGLRGLGRSFASIAAQQLAFRSGLGSIISTLGFFALGTGLTLAVTAGLAAIGIAIRKIRDAAEEADRPLKTLIDRYRQLAQSQEDSRVRTRVDADFLSQQLEDQKRLVENLQRAHAAGAGPTPQSLARHLDLTRQLRREQARLRELREAAGASSRQVALDERSDRDREISDLAAIIDARQASNAQLERRRQLVAQLTTELERERSFIASNERQRQNSLARQAALLSQIKTLTEAGVDQQRKARRFDREALDQQLALLQLQSLANQTREASREITSPEAQREELRILHERRRLIAETIPLLEAQAAALDTPEARQGIAGLRQELAQTELQIVQLRARTIEWQEDIDKLAFQDRVDRSDPIEAFRLTFARSFGEVRAAAVDAGDTARVAFLDSFLDRGQTKAAAEQLLGTFQDQLASLSRQQRALEIQLDTGEIDQATFFERRLELLERERALIAATIPQLRAYAEAIEDPALTQALEDLVLQFEEVGLRIHDVGTAMQAWKQQILDITDNAVAALFTDLLQGSKSVKDAFLDMAKAVVQALNQMIARMIAAKIAQDALGSAIGFSRGGAVTRAARGGMIRGPGTGTSDSIPARLSDGEYVVRAAVVRRPGVRELLDALNYGGRGALLRPRSIGGYASGGLVRRAEGVAATVDGRVDIGLEEGLVARHLESNRAARALLRVVSRNSRAFGRALA